MDFETPAASWAGSSGPLFLDEAQKLRDAALKQKDFDKTFMVSQKLGAKTRAELQQWGGGPSKQALWAYRGDVYDGLDIDSLAPKHKEKLEESIRVISGLYGYVRPTDTIERYRLEMRTKIAGEWGSNLYDFWGNKIVEALLAESPDFIVNATSEEYMKSIRKFLPPDLPIITPKFLQIYPDGSKKDVTIFTKRARGVFARWAITCGAHKAEELNRFSLDGYIFDIEASGIASPVFQRVLPPPKS